MKLLIFTFVLVFAAVDLNIQKPVWEPSSGHKQVSIWPLSVPAGRAKPNLETVETSGPLVAGRPWLKIRNVSRPTMTVYLPKSKNTGAAVIVFPGGGYQILAIDHEGTEVCDWLTSRGITCVLLKYRVPNAGPSWDQQCGCDLNSRSSKPLEDAQRTVGLVRFNARDWHIDPNKIGVLGFSAGGHLVAGVSTRFEHRVYPPLDPADQESCRPDFAIALYPGHLWVQNMKSHLNTDVHVTAQTPPTFLVQAEDDPVDDVNNSLVYYAALKRAGVLVEMHLYAQGGHGFGLRRTNFPITAWPELLEMWLRTIGVVSD